MSFRLGHLFDLTGRTALVTGGNSGIGLAMARGLGLAGAEIVLVARRMVELEQARDELSNEAVSARVIAADLASSEAGTVLALAANKLGATVDVIVNAAGVNLREPFLDVSVAAFDLHMALHLRAPFLLTQAFAPGMAARGWGRIVNIASMQSWRAFPELRAIRCGEGRRVATDARDRGRVVGTGDHMQCDCTRILSDLVDSIGI